MQGCIGVFHQELGERVARPRYPRERHCPGVVTTEGYGKDMGWDEEHVRGYLERVTKEIPVGRVGTVEDIGNAVIYLSSKAGSFINGFELTVDGGMTQIYQGRNGAR
jgi:hypothetical protein